jgi:tetratricopeptide (TPR) repeat protein
MSGLLRVGAGLLLMLCLRTAGHAAPTPTNATTNAKEGARRLYWEATSAYGLGNYGQAAELYEKAFALKADPALLYNAAQAHRIAGHAERATELYRNYLRLFPMAEQGAEAQRHIDALQRPAPAAPPTFTQAGSSTAVAATSAPVALAKVSEGGTAPAPTLASVDLSATAAVTPAESDRPKGHSRTWLWVTLGAAVAAGTIAAVIAMSGRQDPSASLGVVGR